MTDTLIFALCAIVVAYALAEPDIPPPAAPYACAHNVYLCR